VANSVLTIIEGYSEEGPCLIEYDISPFADDILEFLSLKQPLYGMIPISNSTFLGIIVWYHLLSGKLIIPRHDDWRLSWYIVQREELPILSE